MSFAQLKKNRAAVFTHAKKHLEESKGKSYQDDRFWSPTRDKAGNASALIRFLPSAQGEEKFLPWIEYQTHTAEHPDRTGYWFFANCPNTFGRDKNCPLCARRNQLYREERKAEARLYHSKRAYAANILIVSDTANPENNGKVFMYKFGQQIFDIVSNLMYPTPEEQALGRKPRNVFDFWDGSDFELIVKKEDGYLTYKSSVFRPTSALCGDDEVLESIWKQEHALQKYLMEDLTWESNEALIVRFDEFLSGTTKAETKAYDAPVYEAPAKDKKASLNKAQQEDPPARESSSQTLEGLKDRIRGTATVTPYTAAEPVDIDEDDIPF